MLVYVDILLLHKLEVDLAVSLDDQMSLLADRSSTEHMQTAVIEEAEEARDHNGMTPCCVSWSEAVPNQTYNICR